MMSIIQQLHSLQYEGLIIGISTFLIIGIFHPLVIKGEYYFGEKCKTWFLIAGIIFLVASVLTTSILWSTLLGVTAFSCFWSIKEINEQVQRVKRGWFPMNPKRAKYYTETSTPKNC